MVEFKMPKYKYKGDAISLDECYQHDMHYQSPVEIINGGWQTKFEDGIYETILNYGVSVDKDELVKALQYDRGQYEKGFADGCKASYKVAVSALAKDIFEEIDYEIEQAIIGNQKLIPICEGSGELLNCVKGKIAALRGIQGFIKEIKEKQTGVEE